MPSSWVRSLSALESNSPAASSGFVRGSLCQLHQSRAAETSTRLPSSAAHFRSPSALMQTLDRPQYGASGSTTPATPPPSMRALSQRLRFRSGAEGATRTQRGREKRESRQADRKEKTRVSCDLEGGDYHASMRVQHPASNSHRQTTRVNIGVEAHVEYRAFLSSPLAASLCCD